MSYPIGRTIARLRHQRGISQEQLANALQLAGLDVSRDMIMNIERGRTSVSVQILTHIAQILEAEVIEFVQTPKFTCHAGIHWPTCRVVFRLSPCPQGKPNRKNP